MNPIIKSSSFRLTAKDVISDMRCSNFRNAVPKPLPSLTYCPPKTKKDIKELLHFPIKRLPECVVPVSSSHLTNLVQSVSKGSVKCRDDMIEFYLRVFPEATQYQPYKFKITHEVQKMLMYVFSSINLSSMVPFANHHLFSDTRICTGMQQLLERVCLVRLLLFISPQKKKKAKGCLLYFEKEVERRYYIKK